MGWNEWVNHCQGPFFGEYLYLQIKQDRFDSEFTSIMDKLKQYNSIKPIFACTRYAYQYDCDVAPGYKAGVVCIDLASKFRSFLRTDFL